VKNVEDTGGWVEFSVSPDNREQIHDVLVEPSLLCDRMLTSSMARR
jgi:hypothetical protein